MPKHAEELSPQILTSFFKNTDDFLPIPPTFKRGFNGKQFSVPKYFPFDHCETQWILNMYKSNNWERLQRLALVNPFYFSNNYFQIPDNPELKYGRPMFHDKVVMYLTPFALALYLNLSNIVINLLLFRDQRLKPIINIDQPLFLTNVYVKSKDKINDLLKITSPCILILRESFECVNPMLHTGKWRPLKPFSLLYRRPFKICHFSYKDIIEYALSILISKTNLKIPFLFHCMMEALSDEFTLLYYEQVISLFNEKSIEEWVSIPRRLLRFAFYYDKDMRLTGQILRCVQVFQKHSFFFGPTKSCFEICYKQRLQLLEYNFSKKIGDPDTSRVIIDQDCCFCLLFGLMMQSHIYKHDTIKENLLNMIAALATDTLWLLHFIVKRPKELSIYFTGLIEKVGTIPDYIFKQVKIVILKHIETEIVPLHTIKDLNLKPNDTVPVDTAISQFTHMFKNSLGYFHPELILENYSNKGYSDSDSSEKDDVDELVTLIKNEIQKKDSCKYTDKRDLSAEVIRLLEKKSEFF